MPPWVLPMLMNVAHKALRVFCIALVFEVLVFLIARRIDGYLKPALAQDTGRDPTWRLRRRNKLRNVAKALVRTVLYSVAMLFILPALGVALTPPLYVTVAVLTSAACLISLPILQDLSAGYVILAEDQFAPGDQVKVGELTGTVETMSLRQTTLRDAQNPDVVHVLSNRDISRLTIRRERTEPQRPVATPPGGRQPGKSPTPESK